MMIVGIPREIKDTESRVAITPAGVQALTEHGHKVLIEAQAGAASGFSDQDYKAQGAQLVAQASDVFAQSEMVLKVKEPLAAEAKQLREGQILFTYLHLAAVPQLAAELAQRKVTAIAYETVQTDGGDLPLLKPMSEVAGRVAVQIGAHLLEKPQGGTGVLLGGVPGVDSAHVVIIGGGIVGTNAAEMAIGLGAQVTMLDVHPDRLRQIDAIYGGRINQLISNPFNVARSVQQADLLIGAVLLAGARAPRLVTEAMVESMKDGSVIVDVAIDQGGIVETMDRVTTHSDPTYIKHGVIHYAVANMPGIVPQTSTWALTNVTLPYIVALADKGLRQALQDDPVLARGLNFHQGRCTHVALAKSLAMEYADFRG